MATGKKDLKAFVRYDGSGRIIPGSLILSRIQPKVGKWQEMPAYLCGGLHIYVCDAGTAAVNGMYTYAGKRNGKPYYTKGDYRISWGEYPGYLDWEITDGTDWYYYSANDVATPDLVTEWRDDDGDEPIPYVGRCTCTNVPTTTAVPYPNYICIAGIIIGGEPSAYNGTYEYVGQADGKPHYQKDGNRDVYWNADDSKWWIGDVVYSTDDVADPTQVLVWVGSDSPVTVLEGTCTFPETCYNVTLTCTQFRGTAVFGVYYCYQPPAILEVTYGNPQTVCCNDYPVLLSGQGTMELGDSCTTTTTTTTVAP